jgi:hypothetical protein
LLIIIDSVDIILVGFVDYYWFGWYNISRICWLEDGDSVERERDEAIIT